MTDGMLVPIASVLIPTFRRPALLARALRACVAQRGVVLARVELVVVDNDPAGSARATVDAFLAEHPGLAETGPRLVTVHETRPGISHARNTALAHAGADRVVFLDDDQCPSPGWLEALLATASATGAAAVFGPVEPDLDCPADAPLRAYCARYFQRRLDRPDSADITDMAAHMGTQNSLFDRGVMALPKAPEPFDLDLGRIGGEDSVLLRRLVAAGGRLAWSPDALVTEYVPADRCSLGHMAQRRFQNGQIRVLAGRRVPRPCWWEVPVWMAAGAAQAGINAGLWVLGALGRRRDRGRHVAEMMGGLGKVLWMRCFRRPMYGDGA